MCLGNDRTILGFRLSALLLALLFGLIFSAPAQIAAVKVVMVEINPVGPPAASEALIRANIRVRTGDVYLPAAVDDDVRNLYATGFFYNIRIVATPKPDDTMDLTYVLQGKPRLTSLKFEGNKKYSDTKLLKKISSKVGEPLDERKLFTDSQTIRESYEKTGYPGTQVKYVINIDEVNGRGTATFEIQEGKKIKIESIEFVGAEAFTQRKLRKQIKTKQKAWWSWLTGRGKFKEEQFEDDREALAQFYRNNGYIDFQIKDVVFDHPTEKTMTLKIYVFEGNEYKVGTVSFSGAEMFPTNIVGEKFKLKPGAVFAPNQLSRDVTQVEDFYGARGYIDVTPSTGNLRVKRVPNTDTGTMDLDYQVKQGEKSYVEKIEIRGNTKTKDKVIRRELAISPGEPFDMVRVKISQRRLEGLNYFSKVDLRPDPTEVPNRKNLIVGVEEKNTGNFSIGAGFSSVDSIVGFAEVSQGNFDLFKPPTFTGGGQKFRVRVQLGTERQDYIVTFVEPWFLGRKLALGVEAYYRDLDFQSQDDLYTESRLGLKTSLTRALWSDFLIGSVSYTIENVDIDLDNSASAQTNTPPSISEQAGSSIQSKLGLSLAYDTRNSTQLPDGGQRTELLAEVVGGPLGGDQEFYKLELKTAWYFRPYFKGHVIELVGRTGVADGMGGNDVPFYERYYLGGLYNLRGFNYRDVSPRDRRPPPETGYYDEPVGGDTYWFGSAEYSVPVFTVEGGVSVRFAVFYDIGSVKSDSYEYSMSDFSSDWGVGLRLNLPIGPLRLDYAIPLDHDEFSSGNPKFQFGVGYTRDF